MKLIKIKKVIVGAIILVVIIFGIDICTKHFDKNLVNSLSEDLPNTQSLTEEYLTLIKTKYRSISLVNVVRRSKIRNSVAAIEFDKNYQLFIFKIDLAKDTSLNKVLVIIPKIEAKEKVRVTYKLTDAGFYEFMNKSGAVPKVSNIYLGFNANSINKEISNDSLITYGLFTNNLSIQYKENDIADIIIKSKEQNFGNSVSMHIQVLFLKRKSSVFFLTLTAKNINDTVPSNLLYNIVTNH